MDRPCLVYRCSHTHALHCLFVILTVKWIPLPFFFLTCLFPPHIVKVVLQFFFFSRAALISPLHTLIIIIYEGSSTHFFFSQIKAICSFSSSSLPFLLFSLFMSQNRVLIEARGFSGTDSERHTSVKQTQTKTKKKRKLARSSIVTTAERLDRTFTKKQKERERKTTTTTTTTKKRTTNVIE